MTRLLLTLSILLVAVPACGQSTRDKAIHATYVAVEAARVGFGVFDQAHQHELVANAPTLEASNAALADWHTKRAHIVEVFSVAYRAIATAAILSDDQSLSAMVQAAAVLSGELADLGVKFGMAGPLGPRLRAPPLRPLSSRYEHHFAWGVA